MAAKGLSRRQSGRNHGTRHRFEMAGGCAFQTTQGCALAALPEAVGDVQDTIGGTCPALSRLARIHAQRTLP